MVTIALTWRALHVEGERPDPNHGICHDGEAPVGVVRYDRKPWLDDDWPWAWSMTATGADRVQHLCSGREATKEAAKAAVERAYLDLIAVHPDNRANVQARHAEVERRARLFAGP